MSTRPPVPRPRASTYVAVHLKPSTQEMYETVLTERRTPGLGTVPVAAITRDRVKTHLGKLLGAGLSANRVPGANKAAVDRLDDATGRNLYATAVVPHAEAVTTGAS
jgi:hypothetical protein